MSAGGCERSDSRSEVRGSGLECQAVMAQERPRGATPFRVRGGWEELPRVRGQGLRPGGDTQRPRSGRWPRGATPRLRSGVAGRSHLAPEAKGADSEEPHGARGQGRQLGGDTSCPRPGEVTLRSQPEPEARGSSWEEPPTPEARAGGREEHPEEQWLCRQRRAKRSYPTLKVRKGGGN